MACKIVSRIETAWPRGNFNAVGCGHMAVLAALRRRAGGKRTVLPFRIHHLLRKLGVGSGARNRAATIDERRFQIVAGGAKHRFGDMGGVGRAEVGIDQHRRHHRIRILTKGGTLGTGTEIDNRELPGESRQGPEHAVVLDLMANGAADAIDCMVVVNVLRIQKTITEKLDFRSLESRLDICHRRMAARTLVIEELSILRITLDLAGHLGSPERIARGICHHRGRPVGLDGYIATRGIG